MRSVNKNQRGRRSFFAITLVVIALAMSGCESRREKEVRNLRVRLDQSVRHRDFIAAAEFARQILQRAPRSEEAFAARMEAQLQIPDLAGAETTLHDWAHAVREATARRDEDAGDLALARGDRQATVLAWQKALGAEPHDKRLLQKFARLEHGDWPEETAIWTALLNLEENAETRLARANARLHLGEWEDAENDLQQARKLAPNDPAVQAANAKFAQLRPYLDALRELAARLHETSRDDFTAWGDRALIYLRAHYPELALEDCARVAKLATWAVRPKLFQAIALLDLNRVAEAAKLDVRRTITLESLSDDALGTLRRLDAQIAAERGNADLFSERAWQLNDIEQPTLAREDAEIAFKLDNKSSAACTEWSYALMKLGQPQEALTRAKIATDLDPQSATAWQYRGEIESALADKASAVESLSHALALKETAAALQERAACYRALGFNNRAEDDLKTLETLTARTFQ